MAFALPLNGWARQEIFDIASNTWKPVENPELVKTWGCLRAYDADMLTFKQITDQLMKNDPKEYGGKVTISDDLLRKVGWGGVPYRPNYHITTYHAPGDNASEKEKDDWMRLLINMFNR